MCDKIRSSVRRVINQIVLSGKKQDLSYVDTSWIHRAEQQGYIIKHFPGAYQAYIWVLTQKGINAAVILGYELFDAQLVSDPRMRSQCLHCNGTGVSFTEIPEGKTCPYCGGSGKQG